MSSQVLRLAKSLNVLEQAIGRARESVLKAELPNREEILNRLDCHLQVVAKQKVLVQAVDHFSSMQDWRQLKRCGELIRGSSALIQLEVQEIARAIFSASCGRAA